MRLPDLIIEGLGSEGDGVGRLADGRVVFVPGTFPGDRVRVELAGVRKKVQYAVLKEVLEPSAERLRGRCSVEDCGGCALRNVRLEGQARFKRDRVVETLRRIGKIDAGELIDSVVEVGDGWRYRHRVRFHVQLVDGEWRMGYFAPHSHRLVPFAGCPVLWRELEQASSAVAREIVKLPPKAGLKVIELAYSRRDDRYAAKLHGDGEMHEYRRSLAWIEGAGLSGVDVTSGGKRWRHGNVELRYDHARAEEFDLKFDPGVFTQANPELNDALVDAVLRAVRPQQSPRVLELHAGIGNFTLPLGLAGARQRAVERDQRSAILCRRNARTVGLAAEIIAGDEHEALERLSPFDTVLLDPPRIGARDAATVLAARGPPRVVYISCDVATFARDAHILVNGGYQLIGLEVLDMFPETPHVETLAILVRSAADSP